MSPTLDTLPIVVTSNAPLALQKSSSREHAGVAAIEITALVSDGWPSGPHMRPEVRIIAGIEASMMISLGTCRLVMPRSESTIANAGRSAYSASMSA